jgi:O-antigen/teichoic acid export membrane protein
MTLIIGRVASFVLTFFIPIFLARGLAPAEYGTFKQLFLVFTTLYLVLQGGMVQSLYYFIPHDPERRRLWILQAVLFVLLAGILAAVCLLLGGERLATSFSNPALTPYIPSLALFLVLMLASCHLETALITQEQVTAGSMLLFLSEMTRGFFIILPLLIGRSLPAVMGGLIAFAGLRFLISLVYTARVVLLRGGVRPPLIEAGRLRAQLGYALPFGAAVLVDVVQQNLHQYTVAGLFDAATFALYSVGTMQIPLIDFIYTPTTQVLMVQMTTLLKKGSPREGLALWHDVTARLALFFFPVGLFFILIAPDMILFLFKEAYRESVPLFQISALGILPAVFLTDGMLRCYARIPFILLTTIVKIVITFLLIIPLVKIAGLTGAVVAATSVLYIGKGMMLWKTKTLMTVPWREFLPWRKLAGTLLLAGVVFILTALLRQTLPIHPLTALIFDTFFFWTTYTMLLFWTPLLPSSLREKALAAAERTIRGFRGAKKGVKEEAWR